MWKKKYSIKNMITLRRAMNAKQIITKFRFDKKFKKKKKNDLKMHIKKFPTLTTWICASSKENVQELN